MVSFFVKAGKETLTKHCNMKKTSNIFVLLMMVVVGLSLESCNSEDDLNTDQYGNDIRLTSFGPCPVLRGGTLHFLGSNLDQISEVDLPGADPITSIEVIKSGNVSEITIQVPAEKCESGIVTLKTNKGGEIQTVTPITYREDIVFEEFYVGSKGNLVGNVGQTVTIKGDYLNLLHGVIFTDKDTVTEDDFITHDRYTIEVAIPKEARTGTLILTNLEETPTEIETEDALTINLPTATSVSPTTIKAGQTLTVAGKDLDQIDHITIGSVTIAVDAITKNANGTQLSFTVPETVSDDEVTLVTYSGVEIAAGSITTVVPAELSVSPSPVKNGAEITITGKDLDLVTAIAFEGAESASLKSVAAEKVVAVVPETAKTGKITLTLANGKTVDVDFTTVQPSDITFTPATLTAGERLMIRGNDLDLVASITFPGDADIIISEFVAQTASAIGLYTPTAAYGNQVTLTLKNGETLVVKGLTINAATDPAINATTVSGVVGTYVTVEGKNFTNVETVYIGSTKVTKFQTRTDTSMTFLVPASCATGTYDFVMTNYEGKQFTVGKFEVLPSEVTIWEGSVDLGSWSINYEFSGNLFNGQAKEGSTLTIYVETYNSWSQLQVFDGHWGGLNFVNNSGSQNFNTSLSQWAEHEGYYEVVLTADEASRLNSYYDWGYCMIIQGEGCILKKVTLK